jgi:hypothetical protein
MIHKSSLGNNGQLIFIIIPGQAEGDGAEIPIIKRTPCRNKRFGFRDGHVLLSSKKIALKKIVYLHEQMYNEERFSRNPKISVTLLGYPSYLPMRI